MEDNPMTFFDDTSSNTTTDPDIPHHPILIGSDPGAIFAALPSMMGFVPDRSLIIVGIIPEAPHSTRFRVGPVVRADLAEESIDDAVRAMDHALCDMEDVRALLYCVHPHRDVAEEYSECADRILDDRDMRVLGSWWATAIETGATWIDLESEETGEIAPLTDNPMHSHSAVHGAKVFSSRAELDHWLDPTTNIQPLYARTFVDSGESEKESLAIVRDAITVMESITEIVRGEAALEQACTRRKVLLAIAALSRDERLHPLLVTLSVGDRAPIVRELLAETARKTRTQVRRRILALLSTVLAGNGEGMPAFHTLQRCGEELRRPSRAGEIDALTTLMRGHLWQGHMEGKSKAQMIRVAEHGVFWAINWGLPDEAETTERLRREFTQHYATFLNCLEQAVDWDAFSACVPSVPDLPDSA
ncbi:DUF4192 domain-containing protein [Corynebacterium sp. ED61]|uniref:DUF4192 domain-containing protein n=1 Tax=Corynebacterium sp. ED61 TaxID=2211360 RepID=UPI001883CAE6|nr:DUF4192 domain-containing protein [Corynebacterium sp. ED61]